MGYSFAGQEFATKKALLDAEKAIRKPGPRRLDGEEAELVLALWAWLHPDEGTATEAWVVDGAKRAVNHCFAVRLVGIKELRHFSVRRYLLARFDRSLRTAVESDIARAKQQWWAAGDHRCPVTGRELTVNEAVVDHHEPRFAQLAEAFTEVFEVEGAPVPRLKDGWKQNWLIVHAQCAHLRVLSAEANLHRHDEPELFSDDEVLGMVLSTLSERGDFWAAQMADDFLEAWVDNEDWLVDMRLEDRLAA